MENFRTQLAQKLQHRPALAAGVDWFFETGEAAVLIVLYTSFVAGIALLVMGFFWFFPMMFSFFPYGG